uniref:Uncharacterized protein n=1 Tax=Arundo donax TaxID=35708 RepID=A0A0A9EEK2_ARUDO
MVDYVCYAKLVTSKSPFSIMFAVFLFLAPKVTFFNYLSR